MSGEENMRELILASNSPRRKEILSKAGYVFGVKFRVFRRSDTATDKDCRAKRARQGGRRVFVRG